MIYLIYLPGGEDLLKIATLVENSAGEHHGLLSEHGISFYIEKDGHKILFDTGESDAFLHNATEMMIDLSDLEYVFLSHGHYDHSGGLRHLAEISSSFKLKIGQGFFDEKYAYRNGAYDFLGNNFDEKDLYAWGISYSFVTDEVEEILPGVYIISGFPRLNDEKINPRFFVRKGGKLLSDRFDDEILLAIETKKGLVILLGCSHPGMRNMLDAVKDRLDKPLYAVLGGTHLVETKGESLQKSLDYLHDQDLGIIGLSHCTGEEAMSRLAETEKSYFHNMTGSCLFCE